MGWGGGGGVDEPPQLFFKKVSVAGFEPGASPRQSNSLTVKLSPLFLQIVTCFQLSKFLKKCEKPPTKIAKKHRFGDLGFSEVTKGSPSGCGPSKLRTNSSLTQEPESPYMIMKNYHDY